MTEYSVAFTHNGVYGLQATSKTDDSLYVTLDPAEANMRATCLRPGQEDRGITPDAVVVFRFAPGDNWAPVPRFGNCGGCGERIQLGGPTFLTPKHKVNGVACRGGNRYPATFLPIETARA